MDEDEQDTKSGRTPPLMPPPSMPPLQQQQRSDAPGPRGSLVAPPPSAPWSGSDGPPPLEREHTATRPRRERLSGTERLVLAAGWPLAIVIVSAAEALGPNEPSDNSVPIYIWLSLLMMVVAVVSAAVGWREAPLIGATTAAVWIEIPVINRVLNPAGWNLPGVLVSAVAFGALGMANVVVAYRNHR